MDSIVFGVDCGDVLLGHRLTATGLRRDGLSNDGVHADYAGHTPGRPVHPMASLTYRITPVLVEGDSWRDVDATVSLDPPADPTIWDEVHVPGGERDATPGAKDTVGAFGPFIVPDDTATVTVHLTEVTISVGDAPAPPGDAKRVLGDVVVDLATGTARWEPAGFSSDSN